MTSPLSRARRLLALGLALAVTPAAALTDEEIFRDFSLAVPEPGARALSLGGAFVGLADDATAGWSNPAGLTRLRRTEVSSVLRVARLDATRFAFETPEFVQNNADASTLFRGSVMLEALTEPNETLRPAFLSVAVPVGPVVLAGSRQEVLVADAGTRNAVIQSGELIPYTVNALGDRVFGAPQPVDRRLLAEGDLSATLAYYNLALGFELHPAVSVGVTATLARLKVSSTVTNLFVDRSALPGDFASEPTLAFRTSIDDSDVDLTGSLGLLLRPAETVGIGLVYRRGARPVVTETVDPDGFSADRAARVLGERFDVSFPVPDTWGVGLSWRPLDRLTLLADAVRVESSDLVEDFVPGANALSDFNRELEFVADDAWLVRGGLEWLFLRRGTPLGLRVGAYTDPDDRVRLDPRQRREEGLAEVFPGRDDEWHVTAGIGATVNDQLQLDVAVDRSDLGSALVVSAVFRVK